MDENAAAVALFDRHASLYASKYMDVGGYAPTWNHLAGTLPHGAHVLDLACGPGNVAVHMLGLRPDLDWLGIDLSPNMVRLAREHCPMARFEVGDARTLQSYAASYDAVIIAFLLPYLDRSAAIALLGEAVGCLKAGGLICLGTMEDEYSKSGPQTSSQGDVLQMYFHEAQYLVEALGANGLAVIDIRRQLHEASGATDLLIIARHASAGNRH